MKEPILIFTRTLRQNAAPHPERLDDIICQFPPTSAVPKSHSNRLELKPRWGSCSIIAVSPRDDSTHVVVPAKQLYPISHSPTAKRLSTYPINHVCQGLPSGQRCCSWVWGFFLDFRNNNNKKLEIIILACMMADNSMQDMDMQDTTQNNG